MYTIEKTDYGLHVVMGGVYAEQEIRQYIIQKEKLLSAHKGPYSLLIDLRTAMPPSPEDSILLQESHKRMRQGNFLRMAIIVASPIMTGNATQVRFLSKIEQSTRIILSTKMPNWMEAALGWILKGIEPSEYPEPIESIKPTI